MRLGASLENWQDDDSQDMEHTLEREWLGDHAPPAQGLFDDKVGNTLTQEMYDQLNQDPECILTKNPSYYDEFTGDLNDEEQQFKEAMQVELKLKISRGLTKMLSSFSKSSAQNARDKEAEEDEVEARAMRNQD